eukprot:scaffold7470_cov140-Skeletonema_menzelii.AAC.4
MSTFLSTSHTALLAFEQEQDDFECPICYADTSTSTSSAGIILKTCQHQSCSSCLVRWIEKEETSGQESPTCPICRIYIEEDDVHEIIGRSFEPREVGVEEANSEEIDEFTVHWLNENTVLCQGCGSRIEKESGCDLIECLCGYRFCYQCNATGGRCECNEGHGFLGMDWGSREEYIIRPVRDSNGFVDFKSCIEQRRWKCEGQWVRHDRQFWRYEQREESETFWGCMQPCKAIETCHGGWIFSRKTNQASTQMLTNIFDAIEKGWLRDTTSNSNSDMDVGSNWLFLREGADLWALEQLQERCDLRYMRQRYTSRDWDMHHSVMLFQWLFNGIEVRRQRCEMRAANEEAPFNNGAWIFS